MTELRIHDNFEDYENLVQKYGFTKKSLQSWKKYPNIFISDDKCLMHFAKTGEDFWELHITFDKEYRGKKSLHIIKKGILWMLKNKTPRVVCGIPKDKLNVRMLARCVGFKKTGSRDGFELYEIRR